MISDPTRMPGCTISDPMRMRIQKTKICVCG